MNSLSSDTIFHSTVVIGHRLLTPLQPLDNNKPCSFLNRADHHTGMRVAALALYWILFVCVRLSACLSACLCCARLPLHTSPHCIQKAEEATVCCVVDSNRPYKQHHKSSLQTSNSIQLRFGLSHLHLTQVRQDTAVQPLTILAAEVTATLRPLLSENNFFVSLAALH